MYRVCDSPQMVMVSEGLKIDVFKSVKDYKKNSGYDGWSSGGILDSYRRIGDVVFQVYLEEMYHSSSGGQTTNVIVGNWRVCRNKVSERYPLVNIKKRMRYAKEWRDRRQNLKKGRRKWGIGTRRRKQTLTERSSELSPQ